MQKSPEQLSKFLSYVLERRPDEFGLVPDDDGYVKIKDLLKIFSEEDGWRYVRISHLNEILMTIPGPPFEMEDNRIRGKNRERLPVKKITDDLPKLLYTSIRPKAHSVVMDKGVFPSGHSRVILSSDFKFAERLGKRSDAAPVVLTVNVEQAIERGAMILAYGESLFLSDFIPVESIVGPKLPKEKETPDKKDKAEDKTHESRRYAGGYIVNLERDGDDKKISKIEKKRRDIEKSKDKRQRRKEKQKMWPPFE